MKIERTKFLGHMFYKVSSMVPISWMVSTKTQISILELKYISQFYTFAQVDMYSTEKYSHGRIAFSPLLFL